MTTDIEIKDRRGMWHEA